MAEIAPETRNRWFEIKLAGRPIRVWAEKFFDDRREADSYSNKLREERNGKGVYPPRHSHESDAIWAVCVDPQ
jgi:hypothetical protein